MEFERAIFRMHERILQGPSTSLCVNWMQKFCILYSLICLIQFVTYHKVYVNDQSILTTAIEDQLLLHFSKEYQHLPYTHSDAYSFCNLKTFSRSDTAAIQKYASDQLDVPEEEIANKSNDELID